MPDVLSPSEWLQQQTPAVIIPQEAPGQPGRMQLAAQNNNPGNLKNADGSWKQYATPAEGYQDLQGKIRAHAWRGDTLEDYLGAYAPPFENDTETYIQNAEKALGKPRTTKLSALDRDKLAQFQAKQESNSTVKPGGPRSPSDWLSQQTPDTLTVPDHPSKLPTREQFEASHKAAIENALPPRNAAGQVQSTRPGIAALPAIPEEEYQRRVAGTQIADKPLLPLSRLAPETPTTIPGGIAKGAAQLAEGLTTPTNIGLMAGGAVFGVAAKVLPLVPRLVNAGFGISMLKSAYDQSPEVQDAIAKKDWPRAAAGITKLVGTVGMAAVAGRGAMKGEPTAAETKVAPGETIPSAPETPAPGPPKAMAAAAAAIPSPSEFLAAAPKMVSLDESLNPSTAKTLTEGDTRSMPGHPDQVLRRVPIEQIEGTPGNEMDMERVHTYQEGGYALKPELKVNPEGGYTIWEGHHRVLSDVRNGADSVLAWVPKEPAPEAPPVEPPTPSEFIAQPPHQQEAGTVAQIPTQTRASEAESRILTDVGARDLTAEERKALGMASSNNSYAMNESLRAGLPHWEKQAALISSAIRKLPAENDVKLFRGIQEAEARQLANKLDLSDSRLAQLNQGREYIDRGFMSASELPEKAAKFSKTARTIAEISVPKGSPVAKLDQLAELPGEREHIFDRNSTFNVLGRSTRLIDGKRFTVFHLELKPDSITRGLQESGAPAEAVEAQRQAQLIRQEDPAAKLSEVTDKIQEAYPGVSDAEAAKMFARAGNGEKGAITVNPKAINQAYQESKAKEVGQALADIPKRLGTRIAEQGHGAGQQLMDMIERWELEKGVDAGQQFARWADVQPSKLSKDERFQLTDALEGRADPSTLGENVQRAYETARALTDENAGKATAYGVQIRTPEGKKPFMALEDYFPHTGVGNVEALRKGPIRDNVIEGITREGIQPNKQAATDMLDEWVSYLKGKRESGEGLDKILKYIVDSGQAPDDATAFANLQRFKKNVDRYGNMEFSRELNLPFYDRDPVRVIPKMISESARRLNAIKEFGQENEKINAEVLKIARFGGNADYVRKAVDRIVGQVQGGPTAEDRIARFAMAAEVLKLPYVGIQHASQGLNTLLATDFPTFASGLAAGFTKAGRRFAIESGAGTDAAIRDALQVAGGDGSFTRKYLNAVGLTPVMKYNRALAAKVGATWAQKNFDALSKNPDASIPRTRLEAMGIDPDAALADGSLSERDTLRAGKSMSDYTMFRNRPQDLPDLFTGTPLGRVMSQFKHWGYQQSTLIADQIKNDFKEGKGRGLRTLLVLGTLYPAAGMVTQIVKDGLNGYDREFDDGIDAYLHGLTHSAALGMLEGPIAAAGNAQRLGEYALGPTGTDVAHIGAILSDTGTDAGEKMDALTKYAVDRFGGPLRSVLQDQ